MSKHKLIPIEPTKDMVIAGGKSLFERGFFTLPEDVIECCKSMLAAAPEVEQEPVAWARMKDGRLADVFADRKLAEFLSGFAAGKLKPLYLHPQPAPDVTILVEALESIAEYWNQDSNEGAMRDACEYAQSAALAALATYLQQGGDE